MKRETRETFRGLLRSKEEGRTKRRRWRKRSRRISKDIEEGEEAVKNQRRNYLTATEEAAPLSCFWEVIWLQSHQEASEQEEGAERRSSQLPGAEVR